MKIIAPDYYSSFRCIAGACRHTCCEGWEIDIDEDTLSAYRCNPYIFPHISLDDAPHFILREKERCPFLTDGNLCDLILRFGEGALCQICRDHPRFRNFWSDRTEIGLGFVCEEAGRIILGQNKPMVLTILSDDGDESSALTADEEWLLSLRSRLLCEIRETGPSARLKEYLIYRHLPDALYDGRVDERIRFIDSAYREITEMWSRTDGSFDSLVECARKWSYDVEYDSDELEKRISSFADPAGNGAIGTISE